MDLRTREATTDVVNGSRGMGCSARKAALEFGGPDGQVLIANAQ
jgi:hypothetical protein